MSKKQNLKEKEQQIIAEIEKIAGFTPSKLLLSLILNPERVNTLNNDCLKAIVTEYAPYFQKTALTLDGPNYLTKAVFVYQSGTAHLKLNIAKPFTAYSLPLSSMIVSPTLSFMLMSSRAINFSFLIVIENI